MLVAAFFARTSVVTRGFAISCLLSISMAQQLIAHELLLFVADVDTKKRSEQYLIRAASAVINVHPASLMLQHVGDHTCCDRPCFPFRGITKTLDKSAWVALPVSGMCALHL
jgi:hypothetical protein